MKNMLKLFWIIALAVVISLSMTACGGDDDDPTLSELITLSQQDSEENHWVPKTTFSLKDQLNIAIRGTSPDKTISRALINFKKSGTVLFTDSRLNNHTLNDSSFTYYIGYWEASEGGLGNYTVDVYFEDGRGKRSNTMTASFEVK